MISVNAFAILDGGGCVGDAIFSLGHNALNMLYFYDTCILVPLLRVILQSEKKIKNSKQKFVNHYLRHA